jgi:two-component system alkaline phosphatase synthesis response regulator PhoP
MTRVLIVDDEPDILLMLRVNLEADGFETALAADGETALRRIEEERFDLVLLDVMMPVMDGWGVLQGLAADADAPRVIVVSAKSADRDVARALTQGAADYVTKPFSPVDLSGLIERVVGYTPDELVAHRARRMGQLSDVQV